MRIQAQSKAGRAMFKDFDCEEVPLKIAGDLQGDDVRCEGYYSNAGTKVNGCGAVWRVRTVDEIETVAMQLIPPEEYPKEEEE